MVTIGPPKFNIGSQIGQALGQGLQKGITEGSQIGFQRGMLQKALGKVRELSQPQVDQQGNEIQPNPIELLTSLMEAGAGIPGSERYLGQLAPLLLGNLRTESLYGKGAGKLGQENQPIVSTPAEASKLASKFVQGEKPAGFLSAPMNPDQIQEYAAEYARALNDPSAFDRGLSQAESINSSRMQSRNALQQAAHAQGIKPEEMPRFLQYATQFQHLNDLPAIERAAIDKTLQLRNQKDALKNINAPGIYQKLGGVKQHFVPGMTLFKALTSRGETREKALKGYDELIKNLVNEGEEPYVRTTLNDIGLSPTEIEERIHPITKSIQQNIKQLPKTNQLNPQIRQEKLVDFLKNNVSNDTSLSVIRENLMKEKNYDWEEVLEAVKKAFPEGEGLNAYQSAELSNLARPPIQSLSQLFGPTPNFRGFFRGQK